MRRRAYYLGRVVGGNIGVSEIFVVTLKIVLHMKEIGGS